MTWNPAKFVSLDAFLSHFCFNRLIFARHTVRAACDYYKFSSPKPGMGVGAGFCLKLFPARTNTSVVSSSKSGHLCFMPNLFWLQHSLVLMGVVLSVLWKLEVWLGQPEHSLKRPVCALETETAFKRRLAAPALLKGFCRLCSETQSSALKLVIFFIRVAFFWPLCVLMI